MTEGINPTVHTAGLATLEGLINRALTLAPRASAELAELEDCVFALECTSPALDIYLQPGRGRVRLMGFYDGPVTTRVRGAAADFTELAAADDPAASLINGALELAGDSAPLLELQQILGTLDIDWEAPLVDTLGDVVGHQLAEILRQLINKTPIALQDEDFFISASFGVAVGISDLDSLLKRADSAMYKAKEEGRNTVICDNEMPSPMSGGHLNEK